MEVATPRSRLPLRTRSVSGTSWKTSTASCLTLEKSLISIAPMDGCLQISPRTIWRIYNHSMLRSASPWKSRCMSPLPNAVDRRLPPPSIESPLQLVPLPLVLILRHRFMDLAAQTGLGPFRMTARVRGTPSVVILAPVAVRMNVLRNELFLATPLPTGEGPVIVSRLLEDIWTSQASPHRPRQKRFASQGSHSSSRERFASRGSSSPKRRRVAPDAPIQERFAFRRSPSSPQERFASRSSPASSQERFASRRSPSSPQRRFASKGSSSPKRMGFAPEAGPSSSRRPLSRESRSPRPHSSRDTSSPKRGSPSPKRRRYESRDSVSPHHHQSSRALSREPSQGRPHSRSSPNHPSSPSREEKEADETSVPPTVKAMVNFIMKCFPEATASPAHPSSRSFDLGLGRHH